MERQDKPDRDVHCHTCVAALSDFERCQLYNKCVFCADKPRTISKRSYMNYARRQVEIFDLKLKLKKKIGLAEDAGYQFIGILGNLGVTLENDLEPGMQIAVIKELKKELRR